MIVSPTRASRRRTQRSRSLVPKLAAAALVAGLLFAVGPSTPASATGITTSCNLTSNKNPSNAGEPVTFRFFANTDIFPGPPGPTGIVGFFDGLNPIPIHTTPLIPDGLTLDHSTVFFETSSLSPGIHTIRADIILPNVVLGSTPCPGAPSTEQRVESAQSTTVVGSSVNPTAFGQSVTFTATVTRATGGVPQGTVQFKADGNDLGAPTNTDGAGNASVGSSTLSAGSHAITAFFTSTNPNTLNSDGSLTGGQTVQPAATTTSLTSSLNPSELEQGVTFTAALATNSPGSGTPVGAVQFSDNSTNFGAPVALDPTGRASIARSDLTVGPHTIAATFTPDNGNFGASSTSIAQTVERSKTTLVYSGVASGDFHDPSVLSATLTRRRDATPIVGKTVHITMAAESCDGTTNGIGVATCGVTPQQPSGTYSVAAYFAGDAGSLPSSDSKTFTVTREQTSIAFTGDNVILNGGMARMSAVLTEDDGSPSIAGRLITFTLGTGPTQTCTASTDTAGRAACAISPVSQPLGPGTVIARFDQDAYYLASTASATTIVFAFPSRGAFASGDANASISSVVKFFASQWAKDNTLTGGSAPNSFKGFVGTPGSPPRCGGTITARTGNSDQPPDSVPSYMGTLVSSRLTQSGSTITGSTVKIVVVKTAAYGSSPGQGGSGTIVAVVCG